MRQKLKIVLAGILSLLIAMEVICHPETGYCAFFKKSNSASEQVQRAPVARLTYQADRKKRVLKFSQNQLYLKVGDSFTVKSWGLLIDSDCLRCLDVDWQTVNGVEYIFTGLQAGEIALKFTSTTSMLKGAVNVLITNNVTGKVQKSGFKKITYQINNDTMAFSEPEIVVRKGRRFLLLPDPKANYRGSLNITAAYDTLLEKRDFINGGADWYGFKAIDTGSILLECQSGELPFVKGTLKVTVIN